MRDEEEAGRSALITGLVLPWTLCSGASPSHHWFPSKCPCENLSPPLTQAQPGGFPLQPVSSPALCCRLVVRFM